MAGPEPNLSLAEGSFGMGRGTVVPVLDPVADVPPLPPVVPASSGAPTAPEPNGQELLPPLPSLGELVEDSPPWLVSAVLHMLIVIILGLIVIKPNLSQDFLLQFDSTEAEVSIEGELDMPIGLPEADLNAALAAQPTLDVVEPMSEDLTTAEPLLPLDADVEKVEPIRLALSGREAGMQSALLGAYGGTGGTQSAVTDALRWLARNQGRYGLWSLQGPYTDGASNENLEAATAMALIAFQGAGYTPLSDKSGPFADNVAKGWMALLDKQDASGNFFQSGQGTSQLYTQAFCTIALCELYGMTRDERYREPAQRAIDYCVSVQAPEGGWKYFPGTGSDLSVTGWFVMALQSGRMAGLNVPSKTLVNVGEFLDSVSHEYGSYYAYQENSAPTKSMTAEGLLCRQYLGWQHDDERLLRGANYLLENLPDWDRSDRDAYYWYYATQVCHHMEGQHWQRWNKVMRELLPRRQEKQGKERGSWNPEGFRWSSEGGRLFITCLSTYMLEVYYRHLPIYQQDLLRAL
jgi:hypothetical protein